jgi:hypothetical protein
MKRVTDLAYTAIQPSEVTRTRPTPSATGAHQRDGLVAPWVIQFLCFARGSLFLCFAGSTRSDAAKVHPDFPCGACPNGSPAGHEKKRKAGGGGR